LICCEVNCLADTKVIPARQVFLKPMGVLTSSARRMCNRIAPFYSRQSRE
jgi:hypothetical protein